MEATLDCDIIICEFLTLSEFWEQLTAWIYTIFSKNEWIGRYRWSYRNGKSFDAVPKGSSTLIGLASRIKRPAFEMHARLFKLAIGAWEQNGCWTIKTQGLIVGFPREDILAPSEMLISFGSDLHLICFISSLSDLISISLKCSSHVSRIIGLKYFLLGSFPPLRVDYRRICSDFSFFGFKICKKVEYVLIVCVIALGTKVK